MSDAGLSSKTKSGTSQLHSARPSIEKASIAVARSLAVAPPPKRFGAQEAARLPMNESLTTPWSFLFVGRWTFPHPLPTQRVLPLHPLQRFLPIAQCSFQLPRLHCLKYLSNLRSGFQSQREQVITPHEWRWNDRLVREFVSFLPQKIIVLHHAVAALAINPMQLELVFKCRARHEAFQLRHPHVRHVLEDHMLANCFHRCVDF